MAPEELPEDFLMASNHRQLEKSTSMQSALTLFHSDQIRRKEPTSYMKLKAMVRDLLKDQQQIFPKAQKQKGPVTETANPVATVNSEGERRRGDCRQWSSKDSCSRSANFAFRLDDLKKGKEEGQRAPTPTERQQHFEF